MHTSRFTRALTSLAVVAGLMLPTAPQALASSFSDVPSTSADASYIEQLVTLGAISGQAGFFRPYDSLTRAEMCKIAILAAGITLDSSGSPSFTDVGTDHSLFPYVETAARARIVSGFGGNLFMPDLPVTRGQASKIIYNAMKLSPNTNGAPHFWDVGENHSFFIFVETLYNANAVTGLTTSSFGVDTPIMRTEMARFTAKTYNFVHGTTPTTTGNQIGMTTDATSQCIKDRMITKSDVANNIIVQAYTGGLLAAANNAIGVVVKVTDQNNRPVPQLQLRMDVTEGSSGSITSPVEVSRSGVYLGSYTSNVSAGTTVSPRVSLLISEQSNSTRATGYEDVKAFPPTIVSFEMKQSTQVGSVNRICWDLTREAMTIDPNRSNQYLDDYITVIGVVEDGNYVGVNSGINMTLYTTGDSSGSISAQQSAGGVFVYRFQPTNYNSTNNSVMVKRINYLMLQLITTYRVFSSDQMKVTTTYLPRV